MSQILDSSGNPINITTRSVTGGMRNDSLAPAEGFHQGKTMLSKLNGLSAKEVRGAYAKLGADIEAANPSIRSPLLNQSNFYMPESDASTGEPNRLLNQWIAYYVKWNPLVGNILSLHSELPLSRFALRGIDDPQILQFYEEMVESAELHLKMVDMLKNFFTFGEVFPYAFWSDKYNCFTDLTFLDSNFVYVKGHYLLHSEEGDDVQFFELEPDPMLQNIVKSDDYVTGLLRNSLDPEFVAAVRQDKRLMLSNFSTSMMAHKTQYSDLRGTSIVLRCLKRLLYQDKLYEAQYCFTPDTDALTQRGFVPIADVLDTDLVASVNPKTFELEYQYPTETQEFDFKGDIHNFVSRRVDVAVTPNHRMLVKGSTGGWKMVRADAVKKTQKFRATVSWKGESPKTVDFAGYKIDTKTFMEFVGYYVSEGHISHSKGNRGYQIGISQTPETASYDRIAKLCTKLPFDLRNPGKHHTFFVYSKELYYAIKSAFGKGCKGKKISPWVKAMSPELLKILLMAAVDGDGSTRDRASGYKQYSYSSSSKRLADDILEIVIKCGYLATMSEWVSVTNGKECKMWSIHWTSRKADWVGLRHAPQHTDGKHVKKIAYDGKVYCLTVPNGIFISRRNGKIGIHGNSIADSHINPKWIWKLGQAGDLATGGYMPTEEDLDAFRELLIQANNDPIFTIITHYAVNVEAVGLAGKILPIQPELKQIEDDVLTALFANKAVTSGQGPTFATASVAFRAMMSRYIPIRAKVDRFLYHKIFAPVAYANKFYKRKQCDIDNGVRTGDDESNQLIIPQIDWRSKTNLLDDGSVKSIISGAVNSGRLPVKLLVEALDLDYDEVQNYLWNEQGSIFDPVAIESRKALAKTQTSQTMMGQPFLPKKNQPVPIQNVNPEATAKKAGLKRTADNLLSIPPLTPANGKDPVQTQIDKGKPEVGGDPEERNPMAEALKLGAPKKSESDKKPKSKTFDMENGSFDKSIHKKSLGTRYAHRNDTLRKVHRMQDIPNKVKLHEVEVDAKGNNMYREYALTTKGSIWYAEKGDKLIRARTQADAMFKVDAEEVKLGQK